MQNFTSEATSKGYTGHEMVNDFDVIHMGGRTYNPVLGRFMQADPNIQFAGNLQSYNRYSYVMNNPMKYTDPSGYFLKKLMQITGVTAALKFLAQNQFLNGLAQVAVGLFFSPLGSALFNFAQTYAVTGSLGGALRAGLFAAAGAGTGLLGGMGGFAGFVASGVAGGVLSSLQGGNFGHGFFSAGLGSSLGGLGGRVSNPLGQIVVSAVIGGTISKLTGGKFVNGAASAAFATALKINSKISNSKEDGEDIPKYDPSNLTGKKKEIYELMQSSDPLDRQKALNMAREEYKWELDLDKHTKLTYSKGLPVGGHVDEDGNILIGPEAFRRGPEWLASTIYHEKQHVSQGFWGGMDDHYRANILEIQAYEAEWKGYYKFGLSPHEYDALWKRAVNLCQRVKSSDKGSLQICH